MEPIKHWTDELSNYLDGGLSPADRDALEAHLAACRECAETLGDLRRVVACAADLEDRRPDADLWPAIEERLKARPSGIWPWQAGSLAAGRRLSLSLPQLAAVAAVLVLVTAGAMWLALERPFLKASPAGRSAPAAPGIPATAASFDETRYDATVAELERVLNEHRRELDPGTVRVIEQNLAIIDRATSQARRALQADPGNPYLHGHLAEQLRRKIWLLQRASELVTAQS